jgi:DNA-binding response OmpR family regulator
MVGAFSSSAGAGVWLLFGGKIMSTIKVGRILVVEDEELLAATIAEALHDAYEVICAFNVHDAVDHLLVSVIDLVLLDCVLPGGTMWQVVLEADRQDVPVVLMTGDCRQLADVVGGTRPYILKPFSRKELVEVIGRARYRAGKGEEWLHRQQADKVRP